MDAVDVRFTVLGPVRAWRAGTEIALGSPQQCGVLSLLLLAKGRRIALPAMIDLMWADDPPLTAKGTVQTYLSRIRQALPACPYTSLLKSEVGGYALPVDPDALDLTVFENRLAVARAEADPRRAATLLREALALWRGPALTGARGQFVEQERARLDQLRIGALEERIALDVELGRHTEVLVELADLVTAYPLQERLRELRMLALYRAGRVAEALQVYRCMWGLLDRDLGIEPGSGLRALHERILRRDPALDLGVPGAAAEPARECSRPGRSPERELFASALSDATQRFVTLFLHGPGGSGKSALVEQLAEDATAAGRTVLRVDGRSVGCSPTAFIQAAEDALTTPQMVLMIDSFEHCQILEAWLREDFLPRLPQDALVVIAGRDRPSATWRTDLAWAEALRVHAL